MSFDLSGLRRPSRRDFRILTVCTGNICRSPLAELYLRSELADLSHVSVSSAGTMARDGQAMPDQAKTVARSAGLDPDKHEASFLRERDVSEADLVLVMAREHRRDVVSLYPRASRYTFTVREFARLAVGMTQEDLPGVTALPLTHVVDRLNAAVVDVAARRGLVEGPNAEIDDDVVDPYRLSDEVFRQSAQQLYPAVDVVVGVLRAAAVGEFGARNVHDEQ
jgi:protein-tyrosine phosphatase